MIAITYNGTDRTGNAHTGRTTVVSLYAFVQWRYRNGWKALKVYRLSDPANAVGAIFPSPDTGRRVLWVES